MDNSGRASFGGVEIEYETRGAGEAVVFVHHGAGADWFVPLLHEAALSRRFCLVHYHRAGYAGSGSLAGALTFAREAVTLRGFLHEIGVTRAHVVGHSASGCMALQFALDAPDLVHSVAVLEPALMAVPSPPDVARALELYRAGERTSAVDTFLRATCGANAPSVLERVLPGALAQAVADAETFFVHELPALRQWRFGPNEASRIHQPVLAVLGERSDVRFHQRHHLLLDWLPHVESFILAHTGHLLHVENPEGLAAGLADFFCRHPIGAAE
jgi:pimeloyl-ACP methyl ester carboxylesterase